jgi:hypothetical protein
MYTHKILIQLSYSLNGRLLEPGEISEVFGETDMEYIDLSTETWLEDEYLFMSARRLTRNDAFIITLDEDSAELNEAGLHIPEYNVGVWNVRVWISHEITEPHDECGNMYCDESCNKTR